MKKMLICLLLLALASAASACAADGTAHLDTGSAEVANTTVSPEATAAGTADVTDAATDVQTEEDEATKAPETDAETPNVTTEAPVTADTPTPDPEPEAALLKWEDNNGDQKYYEITENEDGTVSVAYTKQPLSECADTWNLSFVNMKADISGIYTGQTTFTIKVKGPAGEMILVKPFDDQQFEKEIVFTGEAQEVSFSLEQVPAGASMNIIIFGAGGTPDVSGEFTIISANFAD